MGGTTHPRAGRDGHLARRGDGPARPSVAHMDTTRPHHRTSTPSIIGAGQAGLSTGYHLQRRGIPFVILDAGTRVGDNWRRQWDSLKLYSPAHVDGLPGLPFPAPRWTFPGKDAVGDYLETYARTFDLPVRLGTRVQALDRDGDGYVVTTDRGRFTCATSSSRPARSAVPRTSRTSRPSSTRPSCSCTRASTAGPARSATARCSWSARATPAPTSPTSWPRRTRRSWPAATAARSRRGSGPGRSGRSSRCCSSPGSTSSPDGARCATS